MRLLHARTLELHEFDESQVPPYAILSHTWGQGEVSLADLEESSGVDKQGYAKITRACQLTASAQLDYVWIDTCSIDKTSSAELSEAINSMYRWYEQSHICFVFLADVFEGPGDLFGAGTQFRNSRWFRRGWTLQELIAPRTVQFFNASWVLLGERAHLGALIEESCGVPRALFAERNLAEYSIAQRMSWAANRTTTRKEDVSYCLLGLFAVNMPLLYGEGGDRAFRRLQEEIIKQSDDQTIFAWGFGRADHADFGEQGWETRLSPLAKSPSDFYGCHDIVPCQAWKSREPSSVEINARGIRVALPIHYTRDVLKSLALLNCRLSDDFANVLAIPVCIPPRMPWSRRTLSDWLEPPRFDNIARCSIRPLLFPIQRGLFVEPKPRMIHFDNLDTTAIISRKLTGSVRIDSLDQMVCTPLDFDPGLKVTPGSGHHLVREEEELGSSSSPIRRALFAYRKPDLPTQTRFYMMLEFTTRRMWSKLFLVRERLPKIRLALAFTPDQAPTCQDFGFLVWRSSMHISGEKIEPVALEAGGTGVSMTLVTLERSWRRKWQHRWHRSVGYLFLMADDTYHLHAIPVFSSFPWPIVHVLLGASAICFSLESISRLPLRVVLCCVAIGTLLLCELLIQTLDRKYGSRGLWVWIIVLFFSVYLTVGVNIFGLFSSQGSTLPNLSDNG